MRSLVHIHGFMGRETYSSTGGVGGMITYLGLAHILVWWDVWGGWGGWDDNVPWTCTHTDTCLRVGWVGWGGMITFLGLAHILVYGWGGWGGMITFLGLAHILVNGWGGWGGVGGMITYLGLAHILVWWDGWGGWDDNVPWTCTHTSLQQAQLREVSSGCSNNTQHLLCLSQVDNL